MSANPMRVTEYLSADHEQLHSRLMAAMDGDRFDASAFEIFRAGLLRHIAIEEKLLLPAVRRARGGEKLSRWFELRMDHAAIGSLLVPTPDRALCMEILSLLATHDAKEEGDDGIYAECERALPPGESERLADAARAFGDIPMAAHFDGHGVCRTVAEARASAARLKRKD